MFCDTFVVLTSSDEDNNSRPLPRAEPHVEQHGARSSSPRASVWRSYRRRRTSSFNQLISLRPGGAGRVMEKRPRWRTRSDAPARRDLRARGRSARRGARRGPRAVRARPHRRPALRRGTESPARIGDVAWHSRSRSSATGPRTSLRAAAGLRRVRGGRPSRCTASVSTPDRRGAARRFGSDSKPSRRAASSSLAESSARLAAPTPVAARAPTVALHVEPLTAASSTAAAKLRPPTPPSAPSSRSSRPAPSVRRSRS